MSLGYWTISTMRAFMESFAKIRNMDPLLPSTWYNISSDAIRKDKVFISTLTYIIYECASSSYLFVRDRPADHPHQDGRVILKKLNGYINAVQCLFPHVHFDSDSFLTCMQSSFSLTPSLSPSLLLSARLTYLQQRSKRTSNTDVNSL